MMEHAILCILLFSAGVAIGGIIALCIMAFKMLLHIADMIEKLGGWE